MAVRKCPAGEMAARVAGAGRSLSATTSAPVSAAELAKRRANNGRGDGDGGSLGGLDDGGGGRNHSDGLRAKDRQTTHAGNHAEKQAVAAWACGALMAPRED